MTRHLGIVIWSRAEHDDRVGFGSEVMAGDHGDGYWGTAVRTTKCEIELTSGSLLAKGAARTWWIAHGARSGLLPTADVNPVRWLASSPMLLSSDGIPRASTVPVNPSKSCNSPQPTKRTATCSAVGVSMP